MKKIILTLFVLMLLVGCSKPAPVTEPTTGQDTAPVTEPITEPAQVTEPEPVSEPAQEPAPGATTEVTIEGKAFNPAELNINVGDTVTWKNMNDRNHVVVINPIKVKSDRLGKEGTFSYTFDKAGTYDTLEVTFGIRGKVIVGGESPAIEEIAAAEEPAIEDAITPEE